MLCGRGSPKTSFPLGWSFLKKNCIILPRRNAPGIVRKCFWKQCFTDLGACRCETRHNCESNTFLAVQSICNGRRDKDVPGSAQTVPLSAGPADAGGSRGLVEPVCRFRTVRLILWVQGEKSCLLRKQRVECTEGCC